MVNIFTFLYKKSLKLSNILLTWLPYHSFHLFGYIKSNSNGWFILQCNLKLIRGYIIDVIFRTNLQHMHTSNRFFSKFYFLQNMWMERVFFCIGKSVVSMFHFSFFFSHTSTSKKRNPGRRTQWDTTSTNADILPECYILEGFHR
jgi:hypothetical protein